MRHSHLAIPPALLVLLASAGGCAHGFQYTLRINFPPRPIPGAPSGLVEAGPPAMVTLSWENGKRHVEYPDINHAKTFHIVVINSGIDGDALSGFEVRVSKEGYKPWRAKYWTSDFVYPDNASDGYRIDSVFLEPLASAQLSRRIPG